jgi:transcriptional regulator with XRE-family HTH domain
MVGRSLAFKIKQLRARGKSYNQIVSILGVSKKTISKVLKAENDDTESTVLHRYPFKASPSLGTEIINRMQDISQSQSAFTEEHLDTGTTGIENSINQKSSNLSPGPGFLENLSNSLISESLPSSSKINRSSLPTWFWRLVLFFIAVIVFIMFLKRIRDNDSPLVLDNSTFADDDDYMSDFDEPQDLDNSISAGGSVNL